MMIDGKLGIMRYVLFIFCFICHPHYWSFDCNIIGSFGLVPYDLIYICFIWFNCIIINFNIQDTSFV